MKSGQDGLNHGHLDLGSFVFDANGERWATDLAGDDYNLPSYFSNLRWTYYRLRAEVHNTLVINPDTSGGQSITASTFITPFVSSNNASGMIADLTSAYAISSKSVKRGIALINNKSQLLIQDEIINKAPSTVYWFFHTSDTLKIRLKHYNGTCHTNFNRFCASYRFHSDTWPARQSNMAKRIGDCDRI